MSTTQAATSAVVPVFDRIVEVEPGRRAVAVRNIPNTLPCFDHHFPRFPVLPGVLLLESMAALAKAAAGGERAWRLASVRGVRFKHFVGPGDQVHITVEVTGGNRQTTEVRATARVGDRVVATARSLALVSADEPWEGTA
ncbi:3-hydroxyacyl-ACP dehydratase FabZ family protein [Streptomyces sp. HUAS TT20]|jgi:3-hydroxyacyl-[acyl-carrier-protein] dehydratase|uniref:3-hydroxyacyl-ACP dehydratase FabZ family protein n=1 Tax=Streptomyces sp. HUAS TT20 TaxID=3447509 RepID=UPI0021D8EBB8|nr:hydroxymyristoyl-ACP dehydratase [Streptomyces sp. HUAS 15-9]UXY33074.1 hydroxymyristoyl-ACP dehydratase [Streptomyces sp. HUAS 15-9]